MIAANQLASSQGPAVLRCHAEQLEYGATLESTARTLMGAYNVEFVGWIRVGGPSKFGASASSILQSCPPRA